MLLFVSIDQMKNYYLEENYNYLGPEMVFQIWSNVFVIENLGRLTYVFMVTICGNIYLSYFLL